MTQTMKKRSFIWGLLLFYLGTSVYAEERKPMRRSIYVEFWGASNLCGIAYDAGLRPGSRFGYRAGFAYLCDPDFSIFGGWDRNRVYSIPLEANCLLGKRRSKFEMALGVNFGLYTRKGSYWKYTYNKETGRVEPVRKIHLSDKAFGYYLFSNIGYRYQRESGFMFRVGLSPSWHFGGRHAVRKTPLMYPYLSFGYTFK